MDKAKIVVVGAGLIGLSTAVCISDSITNCRVSVMADRFSPNTTSDVAAGMLIPHLYPGKQTLHFGKQNLKLSKLFILCLFFFQFLFCSPQINVLGSTTAVSRDTWKLLLFLGNVKICWISVTKSPNKLFILGIIVSNNILVVHILYSMTQLWMVMMMMMTVITQIVFGNRFNNTWICSTIGLFGMFLLHL